MQSCRRELHDSDYGHLRARMADAYSTCTSPLEKTVGQTSPEPSQARPSGMRGVSSQNWERKTRNPTDQIDQPEQK